MTMLVKPLRKLSSSVSTEWDRFVKEYDIQFEKEAFHIEKALLAYMEQYKHAAGPTRVFGDQGSHFLETKKEISSSNFCCTGPCDHISESVVSEWHSFLIDYGQTNGEYHTEKAIMRYMEFYRRMVSHKIKVPMFKDSE